MSPPMRKVLVVSPHFPPNDTPDLHRVRMTAGLYRENGWEPIILAARPGDTGRLIDENLKATVPSDVEVEHVACPPRPLFRAVGFNALGLRAFGAFEAAGDRLLGAGGFELVFLSTTAFPLMRLGARWREKFDVPFVLDIQDPWAIYPAGTRFRRGPKHALMRALHHRLEGATVPKLAGLMAVSPAYIDLLKSAYPEIGDRPSLVSPFGYAEKDFAIAGTHGEVAEPVASALKRGETVCLFAGRVAPAMQAQLKALFGLLASLRANSPEAVGKLRLVFLGTGYVDGASEQLATRLARSAGVADMVTEVPNRVSYLDAQKTAGAAHAQIVLGSEDSAFSPSKLYGALARGKPLICIAPAENRLLELIRPLSTVIALASDAPMAPDAFGDNLARVLGADTAAFEPQKEMAAPFEAKACARRDCALFDQVVSQEPAE